MQFLDLFKRGFVLGTSLGIDVGAPTTGAAGDYGDLLDVLIGMEDAVTVGYPFLLAVRAGEGHRTRCCIVKLIGNSVFVKDTLVHV